MSQTNTTVPTSVLSVRVSDAERRLLQEASDEARTSISDFVRRRAIEAAERSSWSAASSPFQRAKSLLAFALRSAVAAATHVGSYAVMS